MTEFEALVAAAPGALEAIPGAICVCDRDGHLVCFNKEAADLWGCAPSISASNERFCGSHRLYLPDGSPLKHSDGPIAEAIRSGASTRNAEVVMERPDGSRFTALVNIRPLRDASGNIQGAINCFHDISQGKSLADEVLAKSKDLEDFFENSAIALHIVRGDGVILRANKAELDLLGYTAEEYIGQHIAKFHADEDSIEDILNRLSCGQGLIRYPARLRSKDGSIKHVQITSNGRFQNDRLINTRCFTVDVTQQHEAVAAQQSFEERLAATYEAATIGISEVDKNGVLVQANKALSEILGRSRETLLHCSFEDYTHPDDRAEDSALYARQVRGELHKYTVRKRVIRPDGTVRDVDVLSSSVYDRAGRFRYGVRVMQDVTERNALEERIRQSEQHMRDLLEALPVAIYTVDTHGRINFFNKAAVEMAGRIPQIGDEWCVTWRLFTVKGMPLSHDSSPTAVALKEDRPVRGAEAIAQRPDGTMVPFTAYSTPLHDAEGKLIGAVNILLDITERKVAESTQKVLIDELNHRVKNTLATVQSLSRQTARHAATPASFVETFEKRILALARAHDLMTSHQWQDAPFAALVRDVLSPITGEMSPRVRASGPELQVEARTALSFAMVLNELATNAAKYGALSRAGGELSIAWSLESEAQEEVLAFTWAERGGPSVTVPSHRGFGSRLMQRCIEADLAGEFDLVFEPTGILCRIRMPMRCRSRPMDERNPSTGRASSYCSQA